MSAVRDAKKKASKNIQNIREHGIFAIRHCEDGNAEYVYFHGNYFKPKNDKGALLSHICLKKWGHNPPAQYIAEYLYQTASYKMFKDMPIAGDTQSFVIEFHEVDDEFTTKQGKKAYSCRNISVSSDFIVREFADKLTANLKKDGGYSIKLNPFK